MHAAIINNPAQLLGVIAGILRRTPDTRSAKLATSAFLVVIRTIHLPPRMGTAFHDTPAFAPGVFDSGSNFLFRVGHCDARMGNAGMLGRHAKVVK